MCDIMHTVYRYNGMDFSGFSGDQINRIYFKHAPLRVCSECEVIIIIINNNNNKILLFNQEKGFTKSHLKWTIYT